MLRHSFINQWLITKPPRCLCEHPLNEAIRRALSVGLVAMVPMGVANAGQITSNPNPPGRTITVRGSDTNAANHFVNQGTIQVLVGGTLTNQTGGTLRNNALLRNYHGTLTNQAGGTLWNNASLRNHGTLNNAGALQNQRFLYNDTSGTLTNQAGGTLTNNYSLDNLGTLTNQAGGTLANNAGLYIGAGTLTNQAGGTLTNNSRLINDAYINNAGTLQNNGYLSNYSLGTLTNQADGTLTNQTGRMLMNNGRLGNFGTLDNDGTLQNNGTLVNYSDGTLTSSYQLTNTGTVSNAGTLIVTPGSRISGSGTFTQTAGSTVVAGTLEASDIDILGGTLGGEGDLSGPVTVGAGASVNPGNSPGTLSIGGDFTLDGRLTIELFSPTEFDILEVLGAVMLGVNSLVEFEFSYTPSVTDTFDFLRVTNNIIGLDQVHFAVAGLAAGFDYEVLLGAGGLTLTRLQPGQQPGQQPVPEPTPLPLMLTGLGGLAVAGRLQRHRPCGGARH